MIDLIMYIPLAVFIGCWFAQFPIMGGLGAALRERHQNEWASTRISPFGWPFFGREWSFMMSGRHRALGDPNLTKRVGDARRLMTVACIAWAVYAICIFAIGP